MAFNNNQYTQPQMPGAFPDADRDEFGLTKADYEQMMDEVDVTCVDGHYEAVPATHQAAVSPHDGGYPGSQGVAKFHQGRDYQTTHPQNSVGLGQPNSFTDQRGVSTYDTENFSNQGGSGYYHQHGGYPQIAPPTNSISHTGGWVQPDSHTDQPRPRIHDRGNPRSQEVAGYHQPGDYQPIIPPNPFAAFGNTYPAPPVGWDSGLDFPTPSPYDTEPYGRSSYEALPYARSPYEALPYATSPYVHSPHPTSTHGSNACNVTTQSRPQTTARPHGQRLQRQPRRRKPIIPVEYDEVEEGEDPNGEEESEEYGEEEEPTMMTMTKKTKRAAKATEEPKIGLTRVNENGELKWFAKANSKGVLAVRHDDIRPQLIAIAEAERVALGVQYAHPDKPGPGKFNVTSFYLKHLHWGPDREDRPQNLFAWEEDKQENPRLKCPGNMYWEEAGKKYIVLDPHDNPVKDWDLPLTIASNIPGYKIESMRRENMSLKHKDFWARMPSRINFGTRKEPIWRALAKTNTVINMPIERFRFRAGLCSWTRRTGTLEIKAALEKLYGDKIQNNTVRAFGRDLTKREIKEIAKGKEAKFPIEDDIVKVTKKRKRQGPAIKKDSQTRVRPQKRARRERQEASVASEVDDLVMQMPTIDQSDAGQRYPRRSTRKARKVHRTVEPVEELGNQSSTGEGPHGDSYGVHSALQAISLETGDNEERPSPKVPVRSIPGIADLGGGCKGSSWVSSTSEEDQSNEERDHRQEVVPLNIGGSVHDASYEGLISNDPFQGDDASDTVPQRQCPDIADASLQQNESESPQLHPFDLMMNAPIVGHENTEEEVTPLEAHRKRVREFLGEEPECQAPSSKRLCTEQQVLPLPGPAMHEVTINVPVQATSPATNQPQTSRNVGHENTEEEVTPLEAHRKRVREFLGEEEPECQAPPSKRLCTEQQVLPLPGPATHEVTVSVPAQATSPPINQPQPSLNGRAPPIPHAQASKLRKQKLDAEWAQVFEQTFLDLGFRSVNYSEVCPGNDEEVQSLIDALLPTREVYLAWTGEPAPRTDPHQSYRAQFDTIFVAFQDWWELYRSNEELPILTGVVHGGRSIDDWIPPSKDSIYYEAFEKGHRAYREGLSDCSGPGLEDASRIPY